MSVKHNEFNNNNLKSFYPVMRSGWIIKFSTLNDYILLIFVSKHTGQVILRHFNDEETAVNFINMMVEKDPKQIHR